MSAAVAAAAAAALHNRYNSISRSSTSTSTSNSTRMLENTLGSNIYYQELSLLRPVLAAAPLGLTRYESQKRRDWNTFQQYLKTHLPPLELSRCSGAHVLEFLRYLDQFGKTKVHNETCPYFGLTHPPATCACSIRQAWGSLDALMGRLRAAFEENGGVPEMNPFGARAVRLYLRDVRDSQVKARGIAYEKKRTINKKMVVTPPQQQE